ncbi:hypothetical protein L7F22_029805 [Adiantum nelumboides]|nr:hypothetical protein [Adiantum nelumboides]
MDGNKEEGSSSEDKHRIPTAHEIGESSGQAEKALQVVTAMTMFKQLMENPRFMEFIQSSSIAHQVQGSFGMPGTVFRGMQGMVPNPIKKALSFLQQFAENEQQPFVQQPEENGQQIDAQNGVEHNDQQAENDVQQDHWVRRSTRQRRQPERFQPSLDCILLTDEGEPLTYKEAQFCEDKTGSNGCGDCFLSWCLDEELYMLQPEGFVIPGKEHLVADFGVSRLVPDGVQHVSTAVQGTIGYLDPEYFQTLQLTDKSDVYSLGVMLVELISGLKPVDSRTREPRFTNLALLFINHMQEARGEDLIDPRLVEPSTLSNDKSSDVMMVRSSIMAVAGLAHQCLALHGDDRPSMSLLADELRHIARALRDTHYDKDMVNDSPLRPLESKLYKHGEAGAVISQDAEFFVKSTSSTISISNLLAPTMPR